MFSFRSALGLLALVLLAPGARADFAVVNRTNQPVWAAVLTRYPGDPLNGEEWRVKGWYLIPGARRVVINNGNHPIYVRVTRGTANGPVIWPTEARPSRGFPVVFSQFEVHGNPSSNSPTGWKWSLYLAGKFAGQRTNHADLGCTWVEGFYYYSDSNIELEV